MSLQFVHALEQAAELFAAGNRPERSLYYRQLATTIKRAVYQTCFNRQRGLVADTPDGQLFSQHTQVLAVLTNCVEPAEHAALMQRVLTDRSLTACTLYFRYYLNRALRQAGLGDQYLETLSTWRTMVANGHTTFPETEYPDVRSDCHGWSASPTYELLSTVCGIEPAEPGFRTVRIQPHLGPLRAASGRVPTPLGLVEVAFRKSAAGKLTGEITLPPAMTGYLLYAGKRLALTGGHQRIIL